MSFLNIIAAARPKEAGTNPGKTNLIAWYDFASNADAHNAGPYNLTETNGPGYTAGPPSYGTSGNGSGFPHWQQSALDDNYGNVAGDHSFVCRFRGITGLINGDFILTGNGGRTNLRWATAGIDGRTACNAAVSSGVAPSVGVWYCCVVVWDNTAAQAKISVNGAAFSSAGAASSVATGAYFFGASTTTNANPCDIDFAGFYKRKLTQDEVTWLYNSGGTRLYSELA